MKLALDTTTLIDILKGEPAAVAKIESVRAGATLFTTSVNMYEIMRGMDLLPQKSRAAHMQALKTLSSNLAILDFDLAAAEQAAGIYADLRSQGIEIDEPDYLIAGICLANGVSGIMTRNGKHFGRIKALETITY